MLVRELELMHHGVKGMKWGVRRYQNKDGSLTSKGKKHYTDDTDTYNNAENSKNPITRHKQNLINKYLANGYSKEAAEAKAKQRMITEATVAVVGGVAIAVVGKKVATRVGQDYCDKIIKSGHEIQNVGTNSKETFKNKAFYAAINKHDKDVYSKVFPHKEQLSVKSYDGVYINSLKTNKNIKRASNNTARKVMLNMLQKDPEYKSQVLKAMNGTRYGWLDREAPEDLLKNDPKKFYDRFNQALATPQFQSSKVREKFYKELEKKGYNAIIDINDTKYTVYADLANEPTIFFGKDIVSKIKNKGLDESDINKNAAKYANQLIRKNGAKTIAMSSSSYAMIKSYLNQRKVEEYTKEHPNTSLSRKEILAR